MAAAEEATSEEVARLGLQMKELFTRLAEEAAEQQVAETAKGAAEPEVVAAEVAAGVADGVATEKATTKKVAATEEMARLELQMKELFTRLTAEAIAEKAAAEGRQQRR